MEDSWQRRCVREQNQGERNMYHPAKGKGGIYTLYDDDFLSLTLLDTIRRLHIDVGSRNSVMREGQDLEKKASPPLRSHFALEISSITAHCKNHHDELESNLGSYGYALSHHSQK